MTKIVVEWEYEMRGFKVSLMIGGIVLCSVAAWASGPRVISTFKLQGLSTGQLKVCIATYAGWEESALVCSSATNKNNEALGGILRMRASSSELRVRSHLEGFTVESLWDSVAALNYRLSDNAQTAVSQRKARIQALEEEIRAIEGAANNRRCD